MHVYNTIGKKETIDYLIYDNKETTQKKSLINELGRLAQGNNVGAKVTDTIDFIPQSENPH